MSQQLRTSSARETATCPMITVQDVATKHQLLRSYPPRQRAKIISRAGRSAAAFGLVPVDSEFCGAADGLECPVPVFRPEDEDKIVRALLFLGQSDDAWSNVMRNV